MNYIFFSKQVIYISSGTAQYEYLWQLNIIVIISGVSLEITACNITESNSTSPMLRAVLCIIC